MLKYRGAIWQTTLIAFVSVCSCRTNKFQIVYTSKQNDQPTEFNDNQIYRLKSKAIFADFNIGMLNDIDNKIKDSTSIRAIFAPVQGDYNYYQFQSTFKGLAMIFPDDDPKDSIKVFHDILIIKTNKKNKIIDSFHYTEEWGEQPFQYDLFRGSIRNIPLSHNMDISILKLVRMQYFDLAETRNINADDKYLLQRGMIKIK